MSNAKGGVVSPKRNLTTRPNNQGETTMKRSRNTTAAGFTRRDILKLSGLALGGLAISGGAGATKAIGATPKTPRQGIPTVSLSTPPASNEMRITFCGTWYTPRATQACNSVFVELGNGDSFVFDCGSGVVTKYVAHGGGI